MLQTGQQVIVRSVGKGEIAHSFVASNAWIYTIHLDIGGYITVHEACLNPVKDIPVPSATPIDPPRPTEVMFKFQLGEHVVFNGLVYSVLYRRYAEMQPGLALVGYYLGGTCKDWVPEEVLHKA